MKTEAKEVKTQTSKQLDLKTIKKSNPKRCNQYKKHQTTYSMFREGVREGILFLF
jgi:hypothetical protein